MNDESYYPTNRSLEWFVEKTVQDMGLSRPVVTLNIRIQNFPPKNLEELEDYLCSIYNTGEFNGGE